MLGLNTRPSQPKPTDEPGPTVKINYILTVFSASEMAKIVSKRHAKTVSLSLNTSEPWDTVMAQLFVKIDFMLKPHVPTIDFTGYDVMCTIPRVLAKPGISLTCEADYTMLLDRISKIKSPLVNVSFEAVTAGSDKENEDYKGNKLKTKKKSG
jgi:hypothetical protein